MELVTTKEASSDAAAAAASSSDNLRPQQPPHWLIRRAHDALGGIGACTLLYGAWRVVQHLVHHG